LYRKRPGCCGELFATFKKRVKKRKIYGTPDLARSEIFNYIEMLYNPTKRHSHTDGVSPSRYEKDYVARQRPTKLDKAVHLSWRVADNQKGVCPRIERGLLQVF
jgi:hypothetical protein